MLDDVRQFVENFPGCQIEKSDHTLAKGNLQSTQIPETKWSEISIDFVMDLPLTANNKDTILVTVNKASRMVHLAPYKTNIIATGAVASSSASQLRLHLRWSFPEMVWRTRSDLQNLCPTRQHTATTNRITEGVGTEVRRHTHTGSSAAGDRAHQPQ